MALLIDWYISIFVNISIYYNKKELKIHGLFVSIL
jgi:hypothetical protein